MKMQLIIKSYQKNFFLSIINLCPLCKYVLDTVFYFIKICPLISISYSKTKSYDTDSFHIFIINCISKSRWSFWKRINNRFCSNTTASSGLPNVT